MGEVGKRGRVAWRLYRISRIPEFNTLDLENTATHQIQAPQSFRLNVHFSYLNYGYYCLFF